MERGRQISPAEFAKPIQTQLSQAIPMNRYVLSRDGTSLLMDVAAIDPILNIADARSFLNWLNQIVASVRLGNPDVTIDITGLPMILKQETEAIINNFLFVSILGFIGILAVFIIGFKRVGLPSLAAIPLVMGMAWTFAIITEVRGEITLFALTFPVLMFGIGIDFAIHLLAGYSEQRHDGAEPETALMMTFNKVGPGLLTGAITTVLVFLVMMLGNFFGLQDMGFAAGIGVLMALLAMLIVFPAIFVLWDKLQMSKGNQLPDVHFQFLLPLGGWIYHQRYWILMSFLLLTIVAAYFGSQVKIDRNYLNTLPKGLDSLTAQARILEKFGSSNEAIVFFAQDIKEAERIHTVASAVNMVSQVLSPVTFLPKKQIEKIPYLEALQKQLTSLEPNQSAPKHHYHEQELQQVKQYLAEIKLSMVQLSLLAAVLYDDQIQHKIGDLRDIINRIDHQISSTLPMTAERLQYLDELLSSQILTNFSRFQKMTQQKVITSAELPKRILSRLQGKDGAWLVMIYGTGNVWKQSFRDAFIKELARIDSNYAGMVAAWHRGLNLLLTELPKVFIYSSLVVILIVLLDLRSMLGMVLAIVPVSVGMIWMLGIMGMLSIPFNIFSIIAIPILIGIGIDNGIHIYHRIGSEGDLGRALVHCGKPVILTSLTTGIGFGCLMLSIHPGIYSLGLATSIGIISCLLVSLLLLPALVAIFNESMIKPVSK